MKCTEFAKQLYGQGLGLELPEMEAHAETCPDCRDRLAAERIRRDALRRLSEASRPAAPSQECDHRVRAAFAGFRRRQKEQKAEGLWWPIPAKRLVWGGAAVAVLMLLAILPLKLRPGQRPATSSSVSGPIEQGSGALKSVDANQEKPETDVETATDYIAMTPCPDLKCLDGARNFRVLLPESTMSLFGLPVSGQNGRRQVEADVLVGADGTAHAIRFLRTATVNKIRTD